MNKLDNNNSTKKLKAYTLANIDNLPQFQNLSAKLQDDIKLVGKVFPFKANSYVVEELINWDNVPNDPIFTLTFPSRGMLKDDHYEQLKRILAGGNQDKINKVIEDIRWASSPHPAGQMEKNVPVLNGERLTGVQHKYNETVLFFPAQGQTCHAYCTFCFRWPQFIGIKELKFAMRDVDLLASYLKKHPEVTDVLFTGGDPLIMSAKVIDAYVERLLEPDMAHIKNIRFGTKSLAYWPYRFLTDNDSADLIKVFKNIVDSGKHLAIMAHFNHGNELKTTAVQEAIKVIQSTGAIIRTQSPIIKHINDNAKVWKEMWQEQNRLGLIPYYMFIIRDTGACHFFEITLEKAWEIYQKAIKQVSGLTRTVRGPSMSAGPGKIQVLGINEIANEKVFTLRYLQARDEDLVMRPFFAKHKKDATWLDDLEPAFKSDEIFLK